MKKTGRPSQYDPLMCDILDKAEGDAFGAGTITDICNLLGVPYRTVYLWMNEHEPFMQAVMRVRERADELVVSAIRKRATGYTIENPVVVTESTTRLAKASDVWSLERLEEEGISPDEEIEIEVRDEKVRSTKQYTHIPADPSAAKFWLSNRQRKDWSDRKEVEVSGKWGEMIDAALDDDA